MELDEESNNKDFLIKRIIMNLEQERILPALYSAVAYAKTQEEPEEKTRALMSLIKEERFYRKIGFLDIIKSNADTAIEYYDDDKDNDPYAYDAETEEHIRTIKAALLSFVAKAIKEQENDALEKLLEAINQ